MKYNGLFEDEISELLTEQTGKDYSIMHNGIEYRPVTWAFYDDGITWKPVDTFYYYPSANNRYFIDKRGIVNLLAHEEFSINAI